MKFNFGKNWKNFIDDKLDNERIGIAERSLKEFTIKNVKNDKKSKVQKDKPTVAEPKSNNQIL